MTQIFIAYSLVDRNFVQKLAMDLEEAGLSVWYDVSRLEGGAHWRAEIEKSIRDSQYMVVVMSPESVESEWVEREFLFASNLGLKIIPVIHYPCEIPLNYINLQYIDLQGGMYERNFGSLLKALNVQAPSGTRTKRRYGVKTEYVAALIGAVATILAASLPFIFRNAPSSTLSAIVETTPPASRTSVITPSPAFTSTPRIGPRTSPTLTHGLESSPAPTLTASLKSDFSATPALCRETSVSSHTTSKGLYLQVCGPGSEEYEVGPLGKGAYAIGPNNVFVVYATTDGYIYAFRIGKQYNLIPLGDFRDFSKYREYKLSLSFTGDHPYRVTVHDDSTNEFRTFSIPKWITVPEN